MTGTREGDYLSKRYVAPPPPRTLEEIRTARLALADMALTRDDPPGWLREVLEAVGLDDAGIEAGKKWAEPCWPHAGTRRGYIIHLHSYTRMCGPCQQVRDEERAVTRDKTGELA